METPADAAAKARDPFAGIDASQHDVLRNIARIDPAARGVRPAASERIREPRTDATARAASAPPEVEPSAPAPAVSNVALPPPLAAPQTAQTSTVVTPATATTQAAPAPIATAATIPTVTPATNSAPAATTATLSAATGVPAADGRRQALAQPRPTFPVDAMRDGHTAGRVVAALTVGADGTVRQVSIVSSTPTRSFGRAATTALREWRYEAAPGTSAIRVELDFRAE